MKKKIIVVATVFVVALVAAYGVYNNQNKNTLADLMLDNVEALAQSESISGKGTLMGNSSGTRYCCVSGSNSCSAAGC